MPVDQIETSFVEASFCNVVDAGHISLIWHSVQKIRVGYGIRPSQKNVGPLQPCDIYTGFARLLESPGNSWNFVCKISRSWKVLENGNGPGKSWKF